MSELNYWQRARRARISRRTMLSASARAGIGATGLALVGCGDDDDDAAVAQAEPEQQAEEQAQAQAQAQTDEQAQTQAEEQAEEQAEQAVAEEQAEEEEERAVATGPTPTPGGIRYSGHFQSSFTLDPTRTSDQNGVTVTAWVTDKIVRELNSNTGELTGDLAETWEAPDASTLVLNVREGVKWASVGPAARNPLAAAGRAFTVEDMVWNITRQAENKLVNGEDAAFPRSAIYANMSGGGIDIEGNSITLHYEKPDATLLGALGTEMNQIVQPELTMATEDDPFDFRPENMIGTGPHVLTRIELNEQWEVRRNPDYWGPPAWLDGGTFNSALGGDPNASRLAFENKARDDISGDLELLKAIEQDNVGDLYRMSNGSAGPFGLLVNPLKEPFSDPRVIRALHLAQHRHAYINFYNNGLGKLNGPTEWVQETWAIPQDELIQLPGHRTGSDREEDLKEANDLWDVSGGREFGEIPIPFAQGYLGSRGSDAGEIYAQTLNDALQTDQFVATVSTWAEMIPELFAKEFFTYSSLYIGFIGADARVDLRSHFHSEGSQNHFSVNNAKLDELLDASVAEPDTAKAVAITREAQDLILDNSHFGRIQGHNGITTRLMWNYLYHVNAGGTREEGLDGFTFRFHSLDGRETWIDESDPTYSDRPDVQPAAI